MNLQGEGWMAQHLVAALANESFRGGGTGSMSSSIYDTAWVSMVSRTFGSKRHWVFPNAFQYVLDAQSSDGSWKSYSSQVDGILNTMAALLAMLSHQSLGNLNLPIDIKARISKAQNSLDGILQAWDVQSCDQVGFEILIPALMEMLAEHGMTFDFPGKNVLMDLNKQKLSKFQPQIFYANIQTTALHSIEAFASKIDFNKISHHLRNGSIMASPSSTASYLINSKDWDNGAESYLRNVITDGAGKGDGSVPCAFPTTFFEFTWVVSTLLKAGFTASELGDYNLEILIRHLEQEFKDRDGAIGFAPSLLADADDTAKCILTLRLLGRPVCPDAMIKQFEVAGGTHFRTYALERNGSISANCNVLNALLHCDQPNQYIHQIIKTTKYLCKSWSAGEIADKWNISPYYSMMLLAQTFRKLVLLWDEGSLPDLPEEFLKDQIPLVLLQILHRTLHSQNNNGAWGAPESCEITSYALLALIDATFFPWVVDLDTQVLKAIRAGQAFLNENKKRWGDITYTWIEKVTYGSSILSKAYCLAAARASSSYPEVTHQWKPLPRNLLVIPIEKISKFSKFFSRLPLFSKETPWKLTASLVEGYFFLPRLRKIRLDVFPRQNMEEDKYLEYIPFTWTGCNNKGAFLESDLIWDMMIISMLNYQADEFMEAVVGKSFERRPEAARQLVHKLFVERNRQPLDLPIAQSLKRKISSEHVPTISKKIATESSSNDNTGIITPPVTSNIELEVPEHSIISTLRGFIDYVLGHPSIKAASRSSVLSLTNHLEQFLIAHLTHCADNVHFAQSYSSEAETKAPITFTTSRTYWDWVTTTSAVDTSCPYSWSWISCRIASTSQSDPFPTALTKYLSTEFGQRLAVMCRMYNDFGSIARDNLEKNLNSVNFAEFENSGGEGTELERRRNALMSMAEYERESLLVVKTHLRPLLDERVKNVVDVFFNVTDLYGQIYIAKDIASRIE
ncbi:hypothetical protein ACMFMG_005288 [Clarireedia jacksonii]